MRHRSLRTATATGALSKLPAVHWRRLLATGLAVPVAMAAASGGVLLAGTGAAAAATKAATSCTDTWVGGASKVLWTVAKNWSTGHVPGPADNVCVTPFIIVTATGPIRIHSLRLGQEATIVFTGTASQPSKVTIASSVANQGNIELDNAALTTPRIDNANGLESQGTSVVTSPALSNSGDVVALSGRLTLTDSLAQLSNGTLSGGSWDALDNGLLVLPGDVTNLAAGDVGIGQGSAIDDPAGHNALTGLTSIGAQGMLNLTAGSLSLTGGLTSDGSLNVGGYDTSALLTVAGTLTQAQGNLGLLNQSTVTAPTVQIGHGAGLSALGTIDGNLVNNGSVAPAYHLNVTGSYVQTAGATLAAGFVQELQVAGKATLAGTLTASEAPAPTPGTRGTAITFSSLSGGFTSHNPGFNLVTEAHQIDVVAQPQIVASATTVAPGTSVTVTGGDFAFGGTVTILLDKTTGAVLGSARAGDQGDFTATITVPSTVPAGSHKLIAVGPGGRRAEVTITVS